MTRCWHPRKMRNRLQNCRLSSGARRSAGQIEVEPESVTTCEIDNNNYQRRRFACSCTESHLTILQREQARQLVSCQWRHWILRLSASLWRNQGLGW